MKDIVLYHLSFLEIFKARNFAMGFFWRLNLVCVFFWVLLFAPSWSPSSLEIRSIPLGIKHILFMASWYIYFLQVLLAGNEERVFFPRKVEILTKNDHKEVLCWSFWNFWFYRVQRRVKNASNWNWAHFFPYWTFAFIRKAYTYLPCHLEISLALSYREILIIQRCSLFSSDQSKKNSHSNWIDSKPEKVKSYSWRDHTYRHLGQSLQEWRDWLASRPLRGQLQHQKNWRVMSLRAEHCSLFQAFTSHNYFAPLSRLI